MRTSKIQLISKQVLTSNRDEVRIDATRRVKFHKRTPKKAVGTDAKVVDRMTDATEATKWETVVRLRKLKDEKLKISGWKYDHRRQMTKNGQGWTTHNRTIPDRPQNDCRSMTHSATTYTHPGTILPNQTIVNNQFTNVTLDRFKMDQRDPSTHERFGEGHQSQVMASISGYLTFHTHHQTDLALAC